MARSPSAGGGQPLVVSLNCLDDPSLEQGGLAGVAAVEHVPLSAVASGLVEAAAAVLLPSLAFLPRAAQRRLRPWQLLLCLGSADRAADAADLGLRLVHVDAEVADTVMALILGLLRRTHLLSRQASSAPAAVAAGWLGSVQPMCRGLVLGIIGRSAAARCLATRTLAFRMSVLYFDLRYAANGKTKRPSIVFASAARRMDTLNDLLAASDLASLHCALTNDSIHILNADCLQHTKPGAFTVNTGSCQLINDCALKQLLIDGTTAGCALDGAEGPQWMEAWVREMPNVLILPRSADYSEEVWMEIRDNSGHHVARQRAAAGGGWILDIVSNATNRDPAAQFLLTFNKVSCGKYPELMELPWEILMDIFARLEIPDLVRAGSVCTSWNSSYSSVCSFGLYKQQQTPCLLYTSQSDDENVACLYSLAEKRAYKLTLPEPPIHRRHLIGSSHGWLVTVDERSEMHLVNPITCEQIALPSVITIEQVNPIYDDGGAICKYHFSMHTIGSNTRPRPLTLTLGKLRYYLHHKALVFYDASARSYFVVFIHNPFGQLAFARLGDKKWTQISSHTHIQDCIYKDGLLYAVTAFGEIIAFNLNGTVVTTKIIMGKVKNRYGIERLYIAQAPWGDLLQVWRPEHWIKEQLNGHDHTATFYNKAGRMILYKFCSIAKELVEIKSLGGHILFLGSNQSLCCRADEYPQLKPDHVYFTDDIELMALCCERGYRLNIGVLEFETKRMDEIIFPRPWSNCLAPLLIIPNPRKMDSVHI